MRAAIAAVAVIFAGPTCMSPLRADLTRAAAPGGRVLLDAHNCYPDGGRWADRLERALKTGTPIAIEQDLVWYTDPASGVSRSIVSHGQPFTGREPSLKDHFFERVRSTVERALRENRSSEWPLIVLNLDLKTNEPAHHASIWQTLGEYESWLTTAPKRGPAMELQPLDVKPILVLTGNPDAQEQSFAASLSEGARLRLFGAIRMDLSARVGQERDAINKVVDVAPEEMIPERATNYRRWVNFPWAAVERGGQTQAADWTAADRARLNALVDRAHAMGLWIRFYTLNGHAPADGLGWTVSYNFGDETSARARWDAAIEAGVDFVATDQYELFVIALREKAGARSQ